MPWWWTRTGVKPPRRWLNPARSTIRAASPTEIMSPRLTERSRRARGRLARAWDEAKATSRSQNDGFADMLYTPVTEASDRAIVDAVGQVAQARGVKRAQIALAWLRSKPVVTAPLVGASSTGQIDDAVASLDLDLTASELRMLEMPYTPRHDFQGISDEREFQAIRDRIPQMVTTR